MRDGATRAGGFGLTVRLCQEAPIPLDVRLGCAPGELLALVGPSGSGKTTTLRCIAGLHRPAHGVVQSGAQYWLDRENNVDLPPQRRSVGIVFQHYALFPHMTALQNIMAAMPDLCPDERQGRARKLLAAVHLAGLEARRPAQLSGGQQQRVALARALARSPQVLLLDEPFAAVDQVTRRKLQRELAQLRQTLQMPIVLVTHDLEEAALLADRMCILHHGKTLQDAAPSVLMTRPANALVARLIDLRNVFEGTVDRHAPMEGTTWLRWRDYVLETPLRPDFAEGARVCWVIPPANVILHRRDRPSRGERENPVAGKIVEMVALGETTTATLLIDESSESPISFSVPTHVAHRNALGVGEHARVSLLKDGIHLMPWEPLPAG